MPASWVETNDAHLSGISCKLTRGRLQQGGLVFVKNGTYKGYMGVVADVGEKQVTVRLHRERANTVSPWHCFNCIVKSYLSSQFSLPADYVVSCSPVDSPSRLAEYIADVEALFAYQKSRRSPLLGLRVFIRGTEGKARHAKGYFGEIIGVDEERRTAEVGFMNKIQHFLLKSLIDV